MRLLFAEQLQGFIGLLNLRNNHSTFMVILMHINDFVGVHQ